MYKNDNFQTSDVRVASARLRRWRPARRIIEKAYCILIGGLALPAHAETWTIEGTLKVEHLLSRLESTYGTTSPLVGVEVEVFGRSRCLTGWCPVWNSWGTDRTEEDGGFRVTETTGSGRRQVKIKVRFKSNDLKLTDADIVGVDDSPWFRVYQDEPSSRSSNRTLTFKSGGSEELSSTAGRELADLWVLATELLNYLEDIGYPFQDTLTIENGWHNPFSDASFCDPSTGTVHIENNDFEVETVLHEVMHAWMYEHMSGEIGLVDEIFKSDQTHCLQASDETWIAFVEGFSEYCQDELIGILFNTTRDRPMNRPYFLNGVSWHGGDCNETLGTLSRLERHCAGWTSLFRLVSQSMLGIYDFNNPTADGEVIQGMGFWEHHFYDPDTSFVDVLDAITSNSATGLLSKDDMNFEDFLWRMARENLDYPNVTYDTADDWLRLLDPTDDIQPWDLFPEE